MSNIQLSPIVMAITIVINHPLLTEKTPIKVSAEPHRQL